MEECIICMIQKSFFKVLTCDHKLCFSCFKKLPKNQCPYCRQEMTIDEINERKTNNKAIIKPPQIYQPSQIIVLDDFEDYNEQVIVPFARYYRNMNRKRRRNLSFDEVTERRQRIKKKMREKWMRKNGRLRKFSHTLETS